MKLTNINDEYDESDPLGLLADMMIQDAICLIVIYASQIGHNNSKEDIEKIKAIADNCPVCVEKSKGIYKRIYKMTNALKSIDPEKAIEKAINKLNPELRKTAFELVTDVLFSLGVSPYKKQKILDDLANKMSIDRSIIVRK